MSAPTESKDDSYMDRQSIIQRGKRPKTFSSSYDFVIVFKLVEDVSGKLIQSPHAVYVMNTMLAAGLEIFPYESVQKDELIVLVRAPIEVLRVFADRMDYKMELDPQVLKQKLELGWQDPEDPKKKIAPIYINDDPEICPLKPWVHIYGKYDTDDALQDLYLKSSHSSHPFRRFNRLKLTNFLLKAPKRMGGCDLEISKMINKKVMLCMFPLHDRFVRETLLAACTAWSSMPWTQPIHDLKDYFGEKVVLYDVFMGHYSYWLIIPAMIGLVFQLVVAGTQNVSSPVLPFYSLVLTVWAIVMLEYWKRTEATVALRWGMTDFEQTEPDRPEFKGELIKSYIDGSDMLYYPPAAVSRKLFQSQTVIFTFMMIVVAVVASIYYMRFSLQPDIGTYASTVASVANAAQITIFNQIYQVVVVTLTDRENHRTDTMYEDSMIIKLFVFQFINSYSSFFFLAFIAANLQRPAGVDSSFQGQCGAANCMQPLAINLAIIFGTRLTLTNFLDIFIPYVTYKQKVKEETKGIPEDALLSPAEQDFVLMPYDLVLSGIRSYADTAIQFGFTQLFATALPSAAFFALFSNYAKTKFNAWKRFTFYQRPIPVGAQDIGTWQSIFNLLSVVSVITNAGLICFTMDVLDHRSITLFGKTWIFIGFQWTLIGVQFVSTLLIEDEPEEVTVQKMRQDFIRLKMIDHLEDETITEIEAESMAKTANLDVGTKGKRRRSSFFSSATGTTEKGSGGDFCPCFGGDVEPEQGATLKKTRADGLPTVKIQGYPFVKDESMWPDAITKDNIAEFTVAPFESARLARKGAPAVKSAPPSSSSSAAGAAADGDVSSSENPMHED